ncbi:hypothetical protein [Euzebya tangerina]|uniref:hypothetical protein n=1 Tax=Euzebya tangerina TaxID=591198 RepID=UPI000E31C694|nr:hypothetical protein [Euzebya tangerina]
MSRPTVRRLALLVVAVLALAACGSDDSAEESSSADLATLDGSTASSDADQADATEPPTEEEAALAFAACMRDQGIDFPDPRIDGEGQLDIDPQDLQGIGEQPGIQEAFQTCQSEVEGATFALGDVDQTELTDQAVAVAQCLRDRGYDAEDPSIGPPGAGGGGGGFSQIFGPDVDLQDPDVQTDVQACADEAGLTIGGDQ